MKLVAIAGSSRVVASGYEDGLLRIVFTDGAVYDAENIPAEINAAFLASPSKGKFVHEWLKGKLKPAAIMEHMRLREPTPIGQHADWVGPFNPPSAKPINSHDPDPCCGFHISKALRSGELDTRLFWECPDCGQQWKPEMQPPFSTGADAVIRHWRPLPSVSFVPVRV